MRTLTSFRDLHQGQTIIVCGCGESFNELTQPERFITIGVNDVGRRFTPNYLVVVNPQNQFTGDRFSYVESSQAQYLFTQLNLGLARENIVKFQLGAYGGTDFSNPDVLHHTQNSPYVALCLAVHMGATRIGLVGVDFTDHHFFAQTGAHSLTPQLSIIDEQYKQLYQAMRARGVEVVNLSRTSRLTAFPKMAITEFSEQAKPLAMLPVVTRAASIESGASCSKETRASLKIVSYATTPVAGVPAIMARCINARTHHQARCVWARSGYGNGVNFAGDIEWSSAAADAKSALQAADVIIVHNGKVDPQHRTLLAGKPVVTMAHNYAWNVDQSFVRQGFPGVVVGQYQATLPEFAAWLPVPNPIPFWEGAYLPEPKGETVSICYTPLGKHERYPAGHKLYWHAKGYETTMRALDRLASRYSIKLEVIRNGQVSHAESLAMKRRSHILIDECATGSYHRNSLEGLAAGCVVVNGVGLLPGVLDVFRLCAGEAAHTPFVHASLDGIEAVLASLVERGAAALAAEGAANRQWLESHWDFTRQWQQFWLPVVEQSLERARSNPSSVQVCQDARPAIAKTNVSRGVDTNRSQEGVSVIIPHGGRERLPHLAATLANLAQCRGVSEVIVIEMDQSPFAEELARRWADKYVFVHNAGPFHKARAMNTGIPFAEYDLLLWKDNDVLAPAEFVSRADAELRARQLDYLVPYTCVHYMSAVDSEEVMRGTRSPAEYRGAIDYFSSQGISGGAMLVRKSFVLQNGGMPEEFLGWGGEDDAWFYKARLLGRTGITQHQDQHLYHLFHRYSGGYGGKDHIKNNPSYARNLALLNSIRTIRDTDEFAQRFPQAKGFPCPWQKDLKVVFISDEPESSRLSGRIAQALTELYEFTIDQVCAGLDAMEQWTVQPPDSIVIFDVTFALKTLSSASVKALWARTILVYESGFELTVEQTKCLQRAGAILTRDSVGERELTQAGLRSWKWTAPTLEGEDFNAINAALALAQPLSVVLGKGGVQGLDRIELPTADNAAGTQTLPVWLYWEGECPEWIKACQRTVFAHAPEVRLLSPTDFDQLRDVDRDIDLTRLHLAHRADFVRAFLLMKYGGLWIDSDCLVMRSLADVLDLLSRYDFVGHKERQGSISNAFMGARPGSKIAAAFYRRICSILRSRSALEWTTIGNQPLTEVVLESDAAWHEIECALIQPVCWSNPEAFFAVNDDAAHDRAFDERAICYMLSNNNVQRIQATHRFGNLLTKDSFFSYLLKRATAAGEAPIMTKEPRTGSWQQIPFCMEALVDVDPERVLDVGIGFGRWGMLIREFCGAVQNGDKSDKRRGIHVVGIETVQREVTEYARFLYDQIHLGDGVEVIKGLSDRWNLVIFDDVRQHWSSKTLEKALSKVLDTADYVLICSSFLTGLKSARERHQQNGHAQLRTLSDYLSLNPLRYEVHDEQQEIGSGAFLLSRTDPRGLRKSSAMEPVFAKIYQENFWVGDESASGTGSCLAQTAEIRERLPLLMTDLNIKTMLDLPCGDLNWMRHVRLGIEEYIGADIVPQLIEQNQKDFAAPDRRFVKLDVTLDYLPQVDLILCRDCLVHFPLAEIMRALKNLKRSKSKYLLTTTFTVARPNTEIAIGEWRPINFQLPPFNFPPPLRLINEKCTEVKGTYADKCLGLWRLEDLRVN